MRPSTLEGYRGYVERNIKPRLGNKPVGKITVEDIRQMYRELQEHGRQEEHPQYGYKLAGSTVSRIHGVLHEALDAAVQENLIARNPTDGIVLSGKKAAPKQVLNDAQLERFMEVIQEGKVWHGFFYAELTTGLRRGELLALLWSDLDPQNRSVSVTKSVSRLNGKLVVSQPKTQHSIRTLIVPQQAVDLLIQEHSLHPNNPYLFPSPTTGTMYSPETVARIHKRILRDAGLEDCRFHDLRHTFATVALQNGVDIKTLSGMLGHYSSGFTLDTYTHVTRKMQEEAAEKMGQFMEMKL